MLCQLEDKPTLERKKQLHAIINTINTCFSIYLIYIQNHY